ncbi:MAG: hypothetical protein CME25_17185 [Gemmatimonadetes bacterium]|nr:hypothetical protein [Gemmatimonadota bacterium]
MGPFGCGGQVHLSAYPATEICVGIQRYLMHSQSIFSLVMDNRKELFEDPKPMNTEILFHRETTA